MKQSGQIVIGWFQKLSNQCHSDPPQAERNLAFNPAKAGQDSPEGMETV